MRSSPRQVRIPHAINACAKARAEEAGYASVSEWILGLIRYDLSIRKPHYATAEISKLPRAEQDKTDDEIARAYREGESLGGTWFEARLRDAVEQLAGGTDIPASKAARELLRRIGR